jgi:hypothetical protein
MASTSTLNNNTEFAAWLDAHTWFEDAEATELVPVPNGLDNAADSVRLVLSELVQSTWEAGTTRTLRDYALTAVAVSSSTVGPELVFAAGNCCTGIDLLDETTGVAFSIDVPGLLEIRCDSVNIDVRGERSELVRPWLSEREFGATIPGLDAPPPDEWVRRFQEQGAVVCWRVYGGGSEPAPSHAADYVGWFLQSPERVSSTEGGLFFFACARRNGDLAIQWQRSGDNVTDELWQKAKHVLGAFDGASVWSGNCRFHPDEWRSYLKTGVLPDRMGPWNR